MKVVCIDNKSFLKISREVVNYDNSIFGNLTIGNTYNATLVKGASNYYYIEEVKKFIPTDLFVKIEDMREQKLNQLGI